MVKSIEPAEFLALSALHPVVDVRTPAEYELGCIPGAVNVPLFTNDERAQVGTLYKKSGKDDAVELGLKLVGPKLTQFYAAAKSLHTTEKVLMYCWRGGMRSASMAWLFNLSGVPTYTCAGGYKAYRNYIRNTVLTQHQIRILGGMTGSGKTLVLKALKQMGEQVVDLEGMAHHKGSAFGAIGELPQPTNEHFENELARLWMQFDPNRHIWLEDESMSIGAVWLPDTFYNRMRTGLVYNLVVPTHQRISNLVDIYAHANENTLELLAKSFKKIGNRIGLDNMAEALSCLEKRQFDRAAEIALKYYDKTYTYGLDQRQEGTVIRFEAEGSPEQIAEKLIAFSKTHP